jgi:hypothetical protein
MGNGSSKPKHLHQQGILYKTFKSLFERVQEQRLEVSAFQFIDDQIIDIGMPDNAKHDNTLEIRNLDFNADDMSTYEDMKGTVYVKN